jgi:hypothetical protein
LSLELNEARINWFNANSNYNAVVSAAADEGGGQGFVTEYAKPATSLAKVVWGDFEEAQWNSFQAATFASFQDLFQRAQSQYGTWDGFWDAVNASVKLPAGVEFVDFRACPDCYPGFELPPTAFMASLERNVIEPMRSVQTLIDRNGYVTRLYSTMSAEEMTVDPLFTFNASLGEVSNVHTATRVIECTPALTQFEAPWRVQLPGGGLVRGAGSQLTWPAFDDQPATTRIVRVSASGPGVVVEDNSERIASELDAYNATLSSASGGLPSSTGGSFTTGGRSTTGGASSSGGSTSAKGGSSASGSSGAAAIDSSDGCSMGGGSGSAGGWAFTLACAAFGWLKRRRR